MKILPTDVVVRFDEAQRKIRFLVPKSPGQLDDLKDFYELTVPSGVARKKLAKDSGTALVAFMDATHKKAFLPQDE